MFDRPWNQWDVIKAFPIGEEVPAQTLEWLMDYARTHAIPLIYHSNLMKNGRYTGVQRVGYGPPAFVHAVKTSIDPDTDVFRLPDK
jgi:hypothetical protein